MATATTAYIAVPLTTRNGRVQRRLQASLLLNHNTKDKEIIDWLSAKTVDHRPEVNCDGAQHNWWSYLLNDQFAEAQTKLVTFLLIKEHSADSRLASNWPLWLNS